MNPYRAAIALAGGLLTLGLSVYGERHTGQAFVDELAAKATIAKDAAGGQDVGLRFENEFGWLTRHPQLSGGEALSPQTRSAIAAAVVAVPGIGGITWRNRDGSISDTEQASLHCQEDVERILETRTIRFSEASARIESGSERLLDEVADSLRPCVGSIIAITGHTDGNGNPAANVALSRARADAVRYALIGRGIPADGLRSIGVGSKEPIAGLDPLDAANRRIEFSVIVSAPVKPTPIDTPGSG
ncbi:OmpA family protein [Novosphingobium aquimarinum]|uniref:OmpA family protein n=1 Tax=Novosphingobium aquimarinum TaxID=2682494 RepID=UPI0012EBBC0E|nr:OmpA family protein [Novosphingobium aquimarinum]